MADQDPFGGNGVKLPTGEWVPKDHPLAQQAVSAPAPTSAAPAAGTPGAPAATTIVDQSKAAQTYSATPGADPNKYTTNQGSQDVVRNSYLQQATQPTTVDRNDPNVRQQADAYAANVDRQKRDYISDAAERASAKGMADSGAMENERRMAAERAGQAQGSFEAQLVGRELQYKRDQKQQAIEQLLRAGQIDQANALQRELAQIDAQLKQAGLAQSGDLGGRELALKDKLGTGGLNLDLMRLLQQGQQFGDTMGFNVADRTAYWNNQALQNLF